MPMEKSVPMKEKNVPMPRALPASPLSHIGCPSKHVATEAGVPGIFKRMAEIRPPEQLPIYSAISNAIQVTESRTNVRGRNRIMAITVVMPGKAPNMMPMIVPIII